MIRRLAFAVLMTTSLAAALIGSGASAQSGKSAVPVVVEEPRDVVAAIYDSTRARLRKNEASPFFERDLRQKYFSKAFDLLITEAETEAAHESAVAIDFDPITNSQDPDIGPVTLKTDLLEPSKAVVSASFKNRGQAMVVTYDFVKEDGAWRVADIKGTTDKEAWSIRKILNGTGRAPTTLPGMKDADKSPDASKVLPPKRPPQTVLEKGTH